MSDNFMAIKAAIYEMGLLFNQPPGDERITAYAKALMNYDSKQIIYAFKQVINSGSAFFPSLAEILKHLKPAEPQAEDLAALIVDEIVNKTLLHGFYQTERAFSELSPEARRVIGGPSYLLDVCNCPTDQLNTFKAQLRRLAKATLESEKSAANNKQLERLGIDTSRVINFNDKVEAMRRIDFNMGEA